MNDLQESLNYIVFYNGLADGLKLLKEEIYIHNFDKGNFILNKEKDDIFRDEQFEIFWMLIILQFGEYGTSPRSGWIPKEGKESTLKFIDKLVLMEEK